MIILRKIGKDTIPCRVILSDVLVGDRNGVNKVFTVSYEYSPGRIEILYNGQVMTSGIDFEETGLNEITFIYVSPPEDTVLRANYEVGNCDGAGGGVPIGDLLFTDLIDTPEGYQGHSGKVLVVNNDESGIEFVKSLPGITNFIELTDTPTTFSGFENHLLKVNSEGNGIDFFNYVDNNQDGVTNVDLGINYIDISFSNYFNDDNYVLTVSLENKIDHEPSVYPTLIRNKTRYGFSVDFSGDIDSENYYLNWSAKSNGYFGIGGGVSGISSVEEDTSPKLGGNISVGNNLILLDTNPTNDNIHGYDIGYSGEASDMYVSDNVSGFACPLYIKSDGTWASACAASGINHMPCVSLALEEDDGGIKKILWRGIVRKGNWNWPKGSIIYVSTVEGALTSIKPNGGSLVQPVGIAISSDTIRFDPGFNPGYNN